MLHTDGGWGDVNVHCILSSENVVTLKIGVAYRCGVGVGGMLLFIALRHQKMLLRWRCCYVQGNVNLKMLLRWRCCTGLVHLGMLSKWLCGCEEKKLMCISPMVLWWTMTCLCLSKETWNSKKHTIPMGKAKMIQVDELEKKKHWNRGQHIPDMLCACWTNSWYSHVIGRTQNTVKHCEKWYVSNWTTMNFNCLLGNPQPLPYIHV